MQTRFLYASIITVSLALCGAQAKDPKMGELQKEIERLQKLRAQIEKDLAKKEELLKRIEKEKEALKTEREELKKAKEEMSSQRYKKLAKDFEGMEPEMAGEKLSKIDDPVKAAYILYNMKSKSAGEALNYVDPKRVSQIVKILTELRRKQR